MSDTAISPCVMANAIRALAMDAVQAANSGHPGMPMGAADVATVLFTRHIRIDPAHPDWPDRDRFVLSAGHGSMLLYALHHLLGFEDMTLDELRNFRQLGARTAGHPEYGHALGIETTTGPLGQGVATAVGMALAEKMLAARFGSELIDHRTWALAGDGCLMEGISQEAISFAGQMRLEKLTILFDDNHITIDGPTSLSTVDDQCARFAASGWHAIRCDGHDMADIDRALNEARASDRPTFVACRTVIGKGSPNKADSSSAHGSPLGSKEIELTKAGLGWPQEAFLVPPAVRARWSERQAEWRAARGAWDQAWAKVPAADQARLTRWFAGEIAELSEVEWPQFEVGKGVATRSASGKVLNALGKAIPNLLGGSADLAGSNKTDLNGESDCEKGAYGGRNLRFGVREHGMGAIVNGMALHGGV
ncbi:MAG: transketolase, partial [Geminicoccaceae bacterium]|nr:transketolase [Geminicoccaceae bacterium]